MIENILTIEITNTNRKRTTIQEGSIRLTKDMTIINLLENIQDLLHDQEAHHLRQVQDPKEVEPGTTETTENTETIIGGITIMTVEMTEDLTKNRDILMKRTRLTYI